MPWTECAWYSRIFYGYSVYDLIVLCPISTVSNECIRTLQPWTIESIKQSNVYVNENGKIEKKDAKVG